MRNYFFVACLALYFCLKSGLATAQTIDVIRVNGYKVGHEETVELYSDDLKDGLIVFSVMAQDLRKVEITLDSGVTWNLMQRSAKTAGQEEGGPAHVPFLEENPPVEMTYSYQPISNEARPVQILVMYDDGTVFVRKIFVKVNYHKMGVDDGVSQVLGALKETYEKEDFLRLVELFALTFPDRSRFLEAIQKDFYKYDNLSLTYKIEKTLTDEDFQGVTLDVTWEKSYELLTGMKWNDSQLIPMRLARTSANKWQIVSMSGNRFFGSSMLNYSDLKVSNSDISSPDGGRTIKVVVNNIGGTAVNNFKVVFFADRHQEGSETILSTLYPGKAVPIEHEMLTVGPPYTLRVIVDPDNFITETEEDNNSAFQFFPTIDPTEQLLSDDESV